MVGDFMVPASEMHGGIVEMKKPVITVTEDFTKEFNKTVKSFKNDAVLVGVPAEDTKRSESGPITNAAILAMNNFGSALANIPAWPVMSIGLKKVQDEVAELFRQAIVKSLNTFSDDPLDTYYNRAGIVASQSIKKTINDQDEAPPLADSTLAARKSKGFKGNKRLIVTGQARNSITYVVNKYGRS